MAATIPGKAVQTAKGMVERYGDNPVYGQIIEVIEQRAAVVLLQGDRN